MHAHFTIGRKTALLRSRLVDVVFLWLHLLLGCNDSASAVDIRLELLGTPNTCVVHMIMSSAASWKVQTHLRSLLEFRFLRMRSRSLRVQCL